jgi:hypothetical protein
MCEEQEKCIHVKFCVQMWKPKLKMPSKIIQLINTRTRITTFLVLINTIMCWSLWGTSWRPRLLFKCVLVPCSSILFYQTLGEWQAIKKSGQIWQSTGCGYFTLDPVFPLLWPLFSFFVYWRIKWLLQRVKKLIYGGAL